jgi:hypothetical protein
MNWLPAAQNTCSASAWTVLLTPMSNPALIGLIATLFLIYFLRGSNSLLLLNVLVTLAFSPCPIFVWPILDLVSLLVTAGTDEDLATDQCVFVNDVAYS